MFAERLHDAGDGRFLLADGYVHTDDIAAALIDDRIHGDGRLAGLAVANNQLSLAPPDGDHAIDGFDAGLQRLVYGLTTGNARGDHFQGAAMWRFNRTFPVQGLAQGVNHAADQRIADRHGQQLAGPLDLITLFDFQILAENNHADRRLFKVENLPETAGLELNQLTSHGITQAVNASDAVAHFEHFADVRDVDLAAILRDFLLDDR